MVNDPYRLLVEAAPHAIILVDAGGRIVLLNNTAETMFGYSREELLGQSVDVLVPEAFRPMHHAHREKFKANAGRHMGTRDLVARRKDGSQIPVDIGLSSFDLDDQHFVAAAVVDISERRRLEQQLSVAQRMESVGLLAGGVAHDFNNLLTVIFGSAELLTETVPGGSDAATLVTDILHAAERATSLTRQLLAFSRGDVADPKVTSLNTIVADTQKILRRLIGEDISLKTRLDDEAALVRVDPGQWSQVLINLAVNARDAMPRGGLLSIETRGVMMDDSFAGSHLGLGLKPGRYVQLSMTDSGTGMPPDVAQRVFEPFFTTKEKGRGTGLGLSVVQGIVESAGGRIAVQSEIGQGTTFHIFVPAAPDQSAAPAPTASTEDHGPVSGIILVVEDEADVRRIAADLLRRSGYTVLTAANGEQAIWLINSIPERIDLLITDVVMPVVDGPIVAEAIRTRFPGAPVLFTSGYTDDAVVRHGVLRSEVAFLSKPYTTRSLLAKVRDVLSTRKI